MLSYDCLVPCGTVQRSFKSHLLALVLSSTIIYSQLPILSTTTNNPSLPF